MFTPFFKFNDKMYLNFAEIYTIYLSVKLVYWYLKPYTIEK